MESRPAVDVLIPTLIKMALAENSPAPFRLYLASKWLDIVEVDPANMFSALTKARFKRHLLAPPFFFELGTEKFTLFFFLKLITLWKEQTDVPTDTPQYKSVLQAMSLRRATLLAHVKTSGAEIESIPNSALTDIESILDELEESIVESYPDDKCIQRTVIPHLRALLKGGASAAKQIREIAKIRAEALSKYEDVDMLSDDAVRAIVLPLYREIASTKSIVSKLSETVRQLCLPRRRRRRFF